MPSESLIAVPYRIDVSRRNELLCQPESGMGYQYLANAENTVVLNAEVAIEIDEIYDWFEWLTDLNSIENDDERQEKLEILVAYSGDLTTCESHSYQSFTQELQKFTRYSAFSPDNRIRPNGSVLAGTFATTENDSSVVPSGLAAVSRYALPNPAPAIYKTEITPPTGTVVICGTSQPQTWGTNHKGITDLTTHWDETAIYWSLLEKVHYLSNG